MAEMFFRALTAADLANAPTWFAQVDLRADRWRDRHTRSVVAVDGDRILAAGMVWTARAHRGRYWVVIVVSPDHRRRGIATAVYRHLCSLRHDDRPGVACGYTTEPMLVLADALGAHTIQLTPPALVDPARAARLRADPRVVPASRVDPDLLLAANADIYRWTHASWRPVTVGFADVINQHLLTQLDLTATTVAVTAGGDIRAAAMVYQDTDPTSLVAETTDPDDPDGERLVEGCVQAALTILSGRGTGQVELDGYVTDPHFMPVCAKLDPTGPWFRWVEIPPP